MALTYLYSKFGNYLNCILFSDIEYSKAVVGINIINLKTILNMAFYSYSESVIIKNALMKCDTLCKGIGFNDFSVIYQ